MKYFLFIVILLQFRFPITAARLAQLDKRRSAEREAFGSNLGRTNTQGLQITE